MSTDVKPLWATVHDLKDQLFEEQSKRLQAERAQNDAEEQARVAEERAHQAEEEGASWAGFAHALADYYAIDEHADERMPDDMRRNITELLYRDWSTGTSIGDLNAEPIVNGYNEELR